MALATVVRYKTTPDMADENERLIKAVFAELKQVAPGNAQYTALRLEDKVSFVHIALFEEGQIPLLGLPAFKTFVSDIDSRCVEGPVATQETVVGTYR